MACSRKARSNWRDRGSRPTWPTLAPWPTGGRGQRRRRWGRFFEDFCSWRRIPQYGRFVAESPAAELAGRLMGAGAVRFYHDHLLVKAPGTRQPTPWRQERPYYNIDGRQTRSFWIPVDPVPTEASLRFVAGSHLGPWPTPRTFMSQESRWFPEGGLADCPTSTPIRTHTAC